MSGGGGGGSLWKVLLAVGTVICGAAMGLEHGHHAPEWAIAAMQAIGGLMVIFGSCEAMILAVEALGERLHWNPFVAGTLIFAGDGNGLSP